MSGMRRHHRIACARCGRIVGERKDGSAPMAHKCPHGKQCVEPAWSKAFGTRCEECERLHRKTRPVRTLEAGNTVAHALEQWTCDNVAELLDLVADDEPRNCDKFRKHLELARLDCRMMPRIVRLATAIYEKIAKGEMSIIEARQLTGIIHEEGPNPCK